MSTVTLGWVAVVAHFVVTSTLAAPPGQCRAGRCLSGDRPVLFRRAGHRHPDCF